MFNWKRFWKPRVISQPVENKIAPLDLSPIFHPGEDLVPLEDLVNVPCLILLGDPGIGKSTEILKICSSLRNQTTDDYEILQLDLRDYQTDIRLFDVLRRNTVIQRWLNSPHVLQLFFDSLDEGLLAINTLATALPSEFSTLPLERLYLRIACRTADWPPILEKSLRDLWENEQVKVFELTPLTRSDIVIAAESLGIDKEKFLKEIIDNEVEPLATIPVTLNFLLKKYNQDSTLPERKAELYLEGCQLLCTEQNQSRVTSGRAGKLTLEQRMIIAARIAAVSIFSNRSAVWIDTQSTDVPGGDIIKTELVSGVEQINGQDFSIGLEEIDEALGTTLFSSRGTGRLGWSHHTYAEFLAAWYLIEHKVDVPRILNLIVHPSFSDHLIPQLHETVAWLANFSPEIFREVINIEPQILLLSDVAISDIEDRAQLVETYLKLFEEEILYDSDWQDYSRYKKLKYPKIAEQLRPYLTDPSMNTRARRVAIDIVEACELEILQNDLAKIALNVDEPQDLRVEAAYATIRIGDSVTKAKLMPLAKGVAGEDPNDDLKGCGLSAVWPEHISVQELFSFLTVPKQEDYYGTYERFINNDLPENLSPDHLTVALNWISGSPSKSNLPTSMGFLVDEIMLKAWQNLDSLGILQAFARAALSRIILFDSIFGGNPPYYVQDESNPRIMIETDDEKRQLIIQAMLPIIVKNQIDPILLIYSGVPIVLRKDLDWLLEKYQSTDNVEENRIIALLIDRIFDINDALHVEKIYLASKDDPQLGNIFNQLFKPVVLDSPQAVQMQETYQKIEALEMRIEEPPLVDPPPIVRIEKLLERFESGDVDAWWILNSEMTLEERSTRYGSEDEWDLTKLPGWQTSDNPTKERIIAAAREYVKSGNPHTLTWLGTNKFSRPAFAGYRALRLLLKLYPEELLAFTTEIWQKWAPVIMTIPNGINQGQNEEIEKILLKVAYLHAPEVIISTLLVMIEKENQDHGEVFIIRKLEPCWDEQLAETLFEKVKDPILKEGAFKTLLRNLIEKNFQPANNYAETLVSNAELCDDEQKATAIASAQVLMVYAEDAGWNVNWPLLQEDLEFGKQVVTGIANTMDRRSEQTISHLSPSQIAEFYIWLNKAFPPNEDPSEKGFHSITPREVVGGWRDSIIPYLSNLATPEACAALRELIAALPENGWLKRYLILAEENTRRNIWIPPTPKDLFALIQIQDAFLVESGDQLLSVIINSIKRLEAKLQGKTPAVIDLWNEIDRNRFRPKDENDLSNYVKRHLDDDLKSRGIIINREVEIRRTMGSSPGERTDIQIDAIKKTTGGNRYDVITAIIELKGCWHDELFQAMETQLKDRYMRDSNCSYGIYLVGWYQCDQWDDDDYRKQKCPKTKINEAQAQFAKQASELSTESISITAYVLDTALGRKSS